MAATTPLPPAIGPPTVGPDGRREAWGWLGAGAAGFVVGQVMAILLGTLGAAVAGTPGGLAALASADVPPVWFIVVELVGLWCGFGGAAWAVTRSGRHVGFRFRRGDVWYVLLGVGLQFALALAYAPFHPKGFSKPEHHLLGGGSGWVLVIPAVMTIVLAPVFEELFFRGVLLRGFLVLCATSTAVVGVAISVLLDSTLFGLAHLGNDSWIQLPGLIATGVVLSVLAVRTGRLGPSIVTHASFNALAVLFFAVQR